MNDDQGCTQENPCDYCREYEKSWLKKSAKKSENEFWKNKDTSGAEKKKLDELNAAVIRQEQTIKDFFNQRRLMDATVQRLQEALGKAKDVINRQEQIIKNLCQKPPAIPSPTVVVNERMFEACLEFARTVKDGVDKLKMTRTKE